MYSQHGEDDYLLTLVDENIPPIFVDVGASDGIRNSNSRLFLEKGWECILVEPHPLLFYKLLMNVPHENATLIHAAVSSNPGLVRYSDENDYTLSHISRPRERGGFYVYAIRLSDFIDQPIGILDIDTEGMDSEIIVDAIESGVDSEFVVIESNDESSRKFQVEFLSENNYEFLKQFDVNTVWRKKK